jgi:hypothetical protein
MRGDGIELHDDTEEVEDLISGFGCSSLHVIKKSCLIALVAASNSLSTIGTFFFSLVDKNLRTRHRSQHAFND